MDGAHSEKDWTRANFSYFWDVFARPTFSRNVTRGKFFSGGRVGASLCGYDLFLGEHVMYGSSRLGVNTYDKHLMGRTTKPLPYPAVGGLYYCEQEATDVNGSDREPMDGKPTGPIGGNQEILKPYGTHRVPHYTMPITGVNLPWTPGTVTADPMPLTPTKEPTAYVPGFKRYEFSNHLGNVLVTISDIPLGVDAGNDGVVDYYMPDVKTTSDYEPFGAALKERTFGAGSFSYSETLNVVTHLLDIDFDDLCAISYEEDFTNTCTPLLSEDFTTDCLDIFQEDFADSCVSIIPTQDFTLATTNVLPAQDFNSGTYDNTIFQPVGTATLSATGNKLAFTVTGSGQGLRAVMATPTPGTYTATFNYAEVSGTIPSTNISVTGGDLHTVVAVGGGLVEYTFTTSAATTTLNILPGGTGTRTATIDDFRLDRHAQDFGMVRATAATRALTFDGKVSFTAINSGTGVKFTVPVSAGRTYTARFDIERITPSTITAIYVTSSIAGNVALWPVGNSGHVEYTFSVPPGSTATTADINILANGTGDKTVTVDNFSVCQTRDLSFVKQSTANVLSELSFNDKIRFSTSGSGATIKFTMPTVPGNTYTARFKLEKLTPATITNVQVYSSIAGSTFINPSATVSDVSYTFTVPAGSGTTTTDILIVLFGNGTRTATVDDFEFCLSTTRDLSMFKNHGAVSEFSVGAGNITFASTSNNPALKVEIPTTTGRSYTATFDYTRISNIASTTVTVNGQTLNPNTDGPVSFTFRATGALTTLYVLPTGTTGLEKKASIDDFTLCENDNDFDMYRQYTSTSLNKLSFDGTKANFTVLSSGGGLKVALPTTVGKTYTATFAYGKVSPAITQTQVSVIGNTTPTLTLTGSGAVAYTFVASAAQSEILLRVFGSTGSLESTLDGFSLCEAVPSGTFVPQGTLAAPIHYAGGMLNFGTAANGNGVKTTLATTVGEEYTVNFDYVQGTNTTSATVDATGTATQAISSTGHVTYTFTATSATTDIRVLLTGTSGTRTASLDNFTVSYEHEQVVTHQWEGERYRFAFNGMEKENDMYGEGNGYDFGARIYDPRIGRWLARDPQYSKYFSLSPYVAFGDNPLYWIDPGGETLKVAGNLTMAETDLKSTLPNDSYREKLSIVNNQVIFNITEEEAIKSGDPGVLAMYRLTNSDKTYLYNVDNTARVISKTGLKKGQEIEIDHGDNKVGNVVPASKNGDRWQEQTVYGPNGKPIVEEKTEIKKGKEKIKSVYKREIMAADYQPIDPSVDYERIMTESSKLGSNRTSVVLHEILEMYFEGEQGLPYSTASNMYQGPITGSGAHNAAVNVVTKLPQGDIRKGSYNGSIPTTGEPIGEIRDEVK